MPGFSPRAADSSGRRNDLLPLATGDSPCLTPKAARIARAASGLAPLSLRHVFEALAVAHLNELLVRMTHRPGLLLTTLDTFSGIMRTSIEAKGVLGATFAHGRVGGELAGGLRQPGSSASTGSVAAGIAKPPFSRRFQRSTTWASASAWSILRWSGPHRSH